VAGLINISAISNSAAGSFGILGGNGDPVYPEWGPTPSGNY
jgi:hypothetical protein